MRYLIIILCLLSGCQQVYASNQIKACGHQDYPPFMWAQDGAIVGLGPQLAKIIFKELGIDLISKTYGNWKRCLHGAKVGDIDLVVAAYITKERLNYLEYTNTYISDDPMQVFVWKNRAFEFNSWQDLIGKNMGSLLGDSAGQEFDEFVAQNIHDHNINSRIQVYKMLELGRIDFTTTGKYAGLLQLKKYGYQEKIIPLGKPIIQNYLYIAMSKKSPYRKHMHYLNKRIDEMKKDGSIQKMLDNYMQTLLELPEL